MSRLDHANNMLKQIQSDCSTHQKEQERRDAEQRLADREDATFRPTGHCSAAGTRAREASIKRAKERRALAKGSTNE